LPFRESKFLMQSQYPQSTKNYLSREERSYVNLVINIITTIRNIKSEYNLAGNKEIPIKYVNSKELIENLLEYEKLIKVLARAENFEFLESYLKKPGEIMILVEGGGELYFDLKNYLDFEKEKNRIKKEIQKLEEKAKRHEIKLSNKEFLEKAPQEVVEKEKENYREITFKLQRLKEQLKEIESAN